MLPLRDVCRYEKGPPGVEPCQWRGRLAGSETSQGAQRALFWPRKGRRATRAIATDMAPDMD